MLAKPAIWPWSAEAADTWTLDECVRATTAFRSWADLADTAPTYAPTFYPGREDDPATVRAMERVRDAFNYEFALKRSRKAEIRRFGAQWSGPTATDKIKAMRGAA